MQQIVQQGTPFINDGGSFTLMSGILARDPIVSGCVASMVNGGIESFVTAAANELYDVPALCSPIKRLARCNAHAALVVSASTLSLPPSLSNQQATTHFSLVLNTFRSSTWRKLSSNRWATLTQAASIVLNEVSVTSRTIRYGQ
jgi:hypothetical protein